MKSAIGICPGSTSSSTIFWIIPAPFCKVKTSSSSWWYYSFLMFFFLVSSKIIFSFFIKSFVLFIIPLIVILDCLKFIESFSVSTNFGDFKSFFIFLVDENSPSSLVYLSIFVWSFMVYLNITSLFSYLITCFSTT